MDYIDKMVAFETGELDGDDTIELFQELIDSGLAWQMQGSCDRMAAHLIASGHCVDKRNGR